MKSSNTDAAPLVVVLGASGLVGSAVVRAMADRPIRLRLVGRRPIAVPPGAQARIEILRVDLTQSGAMAVAVEGADVVVHLVAHIAGSATWRVSSNDQLAERVNLGLVRDLVDYFASGASTLRGPAPVVVFAGSMSQTGRSKWGRICEADIGEPLTPYDEQKMRAERLLLDATRDGLVRAVPLRLATLFGRGNDVILDRGVVATMMRRALADQTLTMWHDGSVTRDITCTDDVGGAVLAAVDHADALAGRHWLVGTGHATPIAELFRGIAQAVAETTTRAPVPVVSIPPPGHSSPTDQLDFVVDPSAFHRVTGWRAAIRWEDALRPTAAALREHAAVVGP
ncbi:NAD-dependent epimerase/dehydratase family protein [Rhodococcus qingshengii]|uniref:NAD-dependent epimerase/dehydratase family protein n=1 Tax=Rhodococcus qingshengii TaxID=334542 RepID=UPI0036DE321C